MPQHLPPNHRRGEISAVFNGKPYRLCLTLRALAELESAYNTKNLFVLSQKFTTGKLSATDIMIILAAGLRGAGETIEVEEATHAEGAVGFVKTCVELLKATFRGEEVASSLPKKSLPKKPFTNPKRQNPSQNPSLG